MAKTRTQLANRALEKLFLVGSGQSPEAEDTEHVNDVIDGFSEYLSGAGIYTIADFDDIPIEAFEPLALYLAWFCAPDFKKPQDEGMRQMAEYMLRRITAATPSYQVLKAEYY